MVAGGLALAMLAACGYSDPYANQGPVAGVQTLIASPAPGADDFNAGAGQTAVKFPDGLQYIDLKVGAGRIVAKGDKVRVHYTGWLSTGKKFDSSRDRLQPFDFTIGAPNSVIQGWTEGIPGMRIGGKRKLIIPPALGYGTAGAPPTIPANSTLVFEVELLAILPGPSPSPSAGASPQVTPSP